MQVAKNKEDFEQETVIIFQLHVNNVQQLRDLDCLAVRWKPTDICSIFQEKCKSILIEMEMMQKMGTPVPYVIQDVAAPNNVYQHGDSTDKFNTPPPPPVDCNCQKINMSAFPIQQPHLEDLRLVCHLIEHSFLPCIDCVIDHHEHLFVTHKIAHLLCKGHLDDILALLLFYHLKLATVKEDNTDLILG